MNEWTRTGAARQMPRMRARSATVSPSRGNAAGAPSIGKLQLKQRTSSAQFRPGVVYVSEYIGDYPSQFECSKAGGELLHHDPATLGSHCSELDGVWALWIQYPS